MSWLGDDFSATRGHRSRPLARPTSVHNGAAWRWRGGVVWALTDTTATIRTQAEAAFVRDYVASRELFAGTDAVAALGAPVAVRVDGSTPDDYTVVAVRGGLPSHGISDEAGLVARGIFCPALLNGIVPGCHIYQDEA